MEFSYTKSTDTGTNMVTKDYSKSRMRENRTYGSVRGGQSNLIPSTRLTRLRREGCGRRPSKRRGASLDKTFTTGLADDRKAAPFGGWRHHLSPASGGTTTRDLLCATYEIIASRSFIVPPLQRGEGGAVGTKGGKPPEVANHRKAVLDDESKSISRNAAFPSTCIYHRLSQMQRVPRFFASLRMTMRAGRKSRNAGSFLRWQSCIGLPSRAKLALRRAAMEQHYHSYPSTPFASSRRSPQGETRNLEALSFCLPDRNGAAR